MGSCLSSNKPKKSRVLFDDKHPVFYPLHPQKKTNKKREGSGSVRSERSERGGRIRGTYQGKYSLEIQKALKIALGSIL
jgi:hypothetical protein